ncbi:Uncharacterised protein [uncultured archaeon]|nr:Uncharacterised protein [uncultured archaeon]
MLASGALTLDLVRLVEMGSIEVSVTLVFGFCCFVFDFMKEDTFSNPAKAKGFCGLNSSDLL